MREFCSRAHKDLHGVIARKVGREVLAVNMSEAARDAFIKMLRESTGQLAVNDKQARDARRKRQEYVDLDRMAKQERLGVLCRAAERWGVMA